MREWPYFLILRRTTANTQAIVLHSSDKKSLNSIEYFPANRAPWFLPGPLFLPSPGSIWPHYSILSTVLSVNIFSVCFVFRKMITSEYAVHRHIFGRLIQSMSCLRRRKVTCTRRTLFVAKQRSYKALLLVYIQYFKMLINCPWEKHKRK